MDDSATDKTNAAAAKKAALTVSDAAALAGQAEQEVFHAVVTATKGVAHALGAVIKLAWQDFHDLIEAGKARPASQAEVDRAFPPAPAPEPEQAA